MSAQKFVVDTDTLIHAYRYDFPPEGDHSGFWEWLNNLASTTDIIIPEKVIDEIKKGTDGLAELISKLDNMEIEPTTNCLSQLPAVMNAYGVKTEIDIEIIGKGADSYVIAHAMNLQATVVTNEISEPSRLEPRNKKIPDICSMLHVKYMRYPHFLWEMRA